MKKLIWTPRYALVVGSHTGNEGGGWEIAADLVVGVNPVVRAVSFGWGWDADVPLRPWPQFWWDRTTRGGNVSSGLAWFGFFITAGRQHK